ncbi:MAG: DUF1460 domain-containing protein [Bacteroidaceae bacterium]|nr:DUF1460 domain-containing protein [Bacteroidaceae bacterium]
MKEQAGTNLMIFYALKLRNTPYVAHTLEVNKVEKLVVNLKELDCLTLVENVLALTITTKQGSTHFVDFKKNLTRIRYQNGVMKGYTSRNHYFSQWADSNERLGLVKEVTGNTKNTPPYYPFVEQQVLDCSFMTSHPELYKMLKNDIKAQNLMAMEEAAISGRTVRYIPRRLLNRSKKELTDVHEGDILAIVTKKKGLDTTHLGIATWGRDGKLHLLNASQIHKKVVLEPMTLYDYMKKHPSQLGVRVIRPI